VSSIAVKKFTTLHHKILLVDDDDSTRSFLSTVLMRAGFDVVAAADVPEGRKLLETARPDLLIADVRVGAFNGLQLIATCRRRIPTIVLTGFTDPVLEADARQLGAIFVLKPIRRAALLARVEQMLRDHAAATEP
jgi:DNA-binding response OmpR family regulator